MAERKSDIEKLMDDVKGKHAKRVNAILLTMGEQGGDNDAFLLNYFKLLEYSLPKLQRTEVIGETEDQVITIEHVYKKENKED